MISLAVFEVLGLLLLAAQLVRAGLARRNPYANAEAFAPGSMVVGTISKSRRRLVRARRSQVAKVDAELPDLVELMSVVLSSGESIQSAIALVARRGRGQFASAMKMMQMRLELGSTLDAELQRLCAELPTPGVLEFAGKLAIAINRGTPLADSLVTLSNTLRRRAANQLLRKAGANETKMLIPLVTMVLPVTVIFALYPSSAVLQLSF